MKRQAPPKTFAEVIAVWPSAWAMARDLYLPNGTVQKWKERGNIRSKHWNQIVRAARVHNFDQITLQVLADIAAKQKR